MAPLDWTQAGGYQTPARRPDACSTFRWPAVFLPGQPYVGAGLNYTLFSAKTWTLRAREQGFRLVAGWIPGALHWRQGLIPTERKAAASNCVDMACGYRQQRPISVLKRRAGKVKGRHRPMGLHARARLTSSNAQPHKKTARLAAVSYSFLSQFGKSDEQLQGNCVRQAAA